jgi:hypothetical protein
MKKRLSSSLFCVCLLVATSGAGAAELPDFEVGPLVAPPGEKVSGVLEVSAGVDEATQIPVTVVHGAKAGPVLALIAGIHGYEYPPITALQRVRRDLDPAGLSGTVIIVHIANLPSFLGRTIYYSPVDGKNLNRVFPGRADGTVSERIAHAITQHVIEQADFVVDLHCGDGNEALRPYAYWMQTGDEKLDAATKGMLVAFGLDHIVIDTDRPKDPQASVYTANTALTRGKPGITTETGQLGTNDAHWVEMAERGVWNLLRHLDMIEGEAPAPGAIVWLEGYEVVRSPETGIFEPAVRDGYVVAKGAILGRILDYFGNPVQEIQAPFGGVVNYVIATPPISKGEPVAMVSRIRPGE